MTTVAKRSSAPLRIAVETDANIFTTVAREGGSDLGSSTRSAHCTVGVRNSVGFWLIRLFTKCYATRARKKSVTQSHCIWVARWLGPQGITEKFWNFAILLLRFSSHILADTLTLFQSREQIMPTTLLVAPQSFRPSYGPARSRYTVVCVTLSKCTPNWRTI